MNPNDIDKRLTGLQYEVAPVQFHTHDGINSPRITTADLLKPLLIIGAGDPSSTLKAPLGTLYIRNNPMGSISRLYINTDGKTTWAHFTASA